MTLFTVDRSQQRVETLEVSWEDDSGTTISADAVIEESSEFAALLRIVGATPPRADYGIRNASSLQRGDAVEAFLGAQQKTPGEVIDNRDRRSIMVASGEERTANFLITTVIHALADAGAPVLDANGRLVAMIAAGSQRESMSLPIEDIRVQFPDAF